MTLSQFVFVLTVKLSQLRASAVTCATANGKAENGLVGNVVFTWRNQKMRYFEVVT